MGWSGLGIAYGLLGAAQKAHEAFAIASAAHEESKHHYMIAANAMFNLVSLTLPYRTDRLEERRRLASMSEPAWTRIEALTDPCLKQMCHRWWTCSSAAPGSEHARPARRLTTRITATGGTTVLEFSRCSLTAKERSAWQQH